MSFLKTACGLPVVAAVLLAGRTASADVGVWAQNFNGINAQSMGDWSSLGTGTGVVTFRSNTSSTASIVDIGNNNHAMQFTHGDSTGRPIAFSSNFTTSSDNTGNNRLVGSFTYTRLLSVAGPACQFLVDVAGQNTAGDAITAIQLTVESDGHLTYQNGIGAGHPEHTVTTSLTLTPGIEYTFQIDADFSSNTQDTWSLKVTHVSDTTVITDIAPITGINTRAANLAVGEIAFHGGISGATTNASPFAQIDNIDFSVQPVPEAASVGVVLGGIGSLLLRRKR